MNTDPGNTEHRRLRESLGAWVLGSLDGAERHRVERHLADCGDCADEVAAMSAMPGLLNRLSVDEVEGSTLVPSPNLGPGLVTEMAASDMRLRRRVTRWRVVAAGTSVAAAAAVVALAVGTPPTVVPADEPDRIVATADATDTQVDTTGQVAAIAWEWGTTVEVDVTELPARDTYLLWAVSSSGQRERAGTWGATASHGARVRGASSIPREQLATIEVTDDGGELLVSFDIATAVADDGDGG